MTGAPDEDAEPTTTVSVVLACGDATPEELAALIAVVTDAYETETAQLLAPDDDVRSAWSVTQRGMRSPLERELGWTRSSFC